MLARLDPMSLARRPAEAVRRIRFPEQAPDLPSAVGFYRGKEQEQEAANGEAIARKRREIVERIRERRREGGGEPKA